MLSYRHPNSKIDPPTMSTRATDWYVALHDGEGFSISPDELRANASSRAELVGDLRSLASAIDAEAVARGINALGIAGIHAHTVVRRSHIDYAETGVVHVDYTAGEQTAWTWNAFDLQAARILTQRLQSLPPAEAIARTLAQCEQPTYTERELDALDAEVDAELAAQDAADPEFLADLAEAQRSNG